MARVFQKARVLRICRLKCREFKCIDPHLMRGLFVIAARITAHLEPYFRNAAHYWFWDWSVTKIRGCHLRAASAVTGWRTPLVRKYFKNLFGGWLLRRKREFRFDTPHDAGSRVVAHARLQRSAPAKKSLHERKFFGREPVRAILVRGRLRGLVPLRGDRFERLLVNHHGAGNVITQPFALGADPRAQHADSVDKWQLIDEAQQISANRVNRRNGLAGILDHADVRQAFAGRLPVPDRFE